MLLLAAALLFLAEGGEDPAPSPETAALRFLKRQQEEDGRYASTKESSPAFLFWAAFATGSRP